MDISGAAGRAVLEINFAITGEFILTASLLIGGLLLCTDYLVIRTTAAVLHFPTKLLLIAAGQMSGLCVLALPKRKQTDLDEENIAAKNRRMTRTGPSLS